MSGKETGGNGVIRILSRTGDPFLIPSEPAPEQCIEALNALYFEGLIDLGGIAEMDGVRYVCTREGWRKL